MRKTPSGRDVTDLWADAASTRSSTSRGTGARDGKAPELSEDEGDDEYDSWAGSQAGPADLADLGLGLGGESSLSRRVTDSADAGVDAIESAATSELLSIVAAIQRVCERAGKHGAPDLDKDALLNALHAKRRDKPRLWTPLVENAAKMMLMAVDDAL